MIVLRGVNLAGLGSYDLLTPCGSIPCGDAYRKPGNYCQGDPDAQGYTATIGFTATGALDSANKSGMCAAGSSSPGSAAQSWWQTALLDVAGAIKPGIQAVSSSGGSAPATTTAPAATPWYKTPFGIGAIALGVLGGAYLIAK